ncbi:MAG: helix-turn-helix transcriptional regulator [Intrasporangium sp.]|uniref:helix-turn-helix domain-containing protein n=1 Tax=Intrasporangium sp. TaxID=1925024 RepID=UPI00264A2CFE|nr:helix-turn-helix transcriptional regulator [Intrasporangium sp.]MDN5795829.1 helix-turn-helix transcriptional regulator [Intrasporangium sp.]
MTGPISAVWESQRAAMGAFIRSQRELANMSLRELSRATRVSNAYLSQVERGLHDPTLRILVQIGEALDLSVEEMLRQQVISERAGGPGTDAPPADASESGLVSVETAIDRDPVLSEVEKEALRSVYRSYLRAAAERARTQRDAAQDPPTASPAAATAETPSRDRGRR